jgi:hypothetical protein
VFRGKWRGKKGFWLGKILLMRLKQPQVVTPIHHFYTYLLTPQIWRVGVGWWRTAEGGANEGFSFEKNHPYEAKKAPSTPPRRRGMCFVCIKRKERCPKSRKVLKFLEIFLHCNGFFSF